MSTDQELIFRTPPASCPRCKTRLELNYDELNCLPCGYVWYTFDVPALGDKSNPLRTSLMRVLRYLGKEPSLVDVTCNYRFTGTVGSHARPLWFPDCVWCEGNPAMAMMAGVHYNPRREGADRFRCARGHRIWVLEDGGGWK